MGRRRRNGDEGTPYEQAVNDDGLDDPDVADLNNPEMEALADPPLLGARPKPSDLGFGEEAQGFGRATSPKLYASAAQFPTAVQFRVWRWENGVPVGLGSIDAEATEEDFVRAFFEAMPKKGQNQFQFRMRPIDIRGQELGKEFTLNISEHHATLRQIRELKKSEEEEQRTGGNWRQGMNGGGDIIVNGGQQDAVGASYAEEMGRMFEQAVQSAEEQNRVLRGSLEMERERLREEEKTRADERVGLAQRASDTVEKMMERLMASDRSRSEEQMKTQTQHSGFMMNTLTGVFGQQQEAARSQAERIREQDAARMTQDREFFERQRLELETRRQRERDEADAKRRAEREEWEARRLTEKDEAERKRRTEIEEVERKRRAEGEDWERKRQEERERMSAEQHRWEDSRKGESEQLRAEAQRREQEIERRRIQDKEEADRRRDLERDAMQLREKESERRREQEREETRLRIERERNELEERREQLKSEREQLRQELEEKRRQETQDFERKMAAEREDRERRERADRERWERERGEGDKKREDERREWERREALRREEMQREADRRREEMALQMKQMEMQAEKDRQHAERMMEMARLEREAQRDTGLQREKMEREGREAADKERQRQHELAMREMELSKDRDREHAERMLQMTKMERSGGLSGITEMLGMEAPEVLAKIFGGAKEGEDGSSWADAIPKVLAAVAEVGARVLAQGPPPGARPPQQQQHEKPRVLDAQQRMIPIQTPEGIKMIPADVFARLQAQQAQQQRQRVPAQQEEEEPSDLPNKPFSPPEEPVQAEKKKAVAPEAAPAPTVDTVTPEYRAAEKVNPIKRAKESGMKLSSQRSARRAIRELMPKLEKAPETEWVGLVTEALMKEPAIYEYLKVVTVYVAMVEAKIPATLADRAVQEMRKSGMIPAEVPFDEADLARLQAGKEGA